MGIAAPMWRAGGATKTNPNLSLPAPANHPEKKQKHTNYKEFFTILWRPNQSIVPFLQMEVPSSGTQKLLPISVQELNTWFGKGRTLGHYKKRAPENRELFRFLHLITFSKNEKRLYQALQYKNNANLW